MNHFYPPALDAVCASAVPQPIEGPGTLHLRFFEREASRDRTLRALASRGFRFGCEGDMLCVRVPGDAAPLVLLLGETLFAGEQNAVRAIWETPDKPLSLRDCFAVESLRAWLARAQSGWFLELLREKRFETHFQPIIAVAAPERVFAFEGLLRGRTEAGLVAPGALFEVARVLGLSRVLDEAARTRAIESASRHGLRSKLFLNISPTALGDGRDTLRSTLRAIENSSLRREQIVFEVIESECIEDVPQLRRALDDLRGAGFQVALDDLGAGYASLQLLGQLRPDYVKLDREMVSGVDCDPFKALIAQKLLETARALNIVTVAEGVESRAQWQWLRAHGGDFAQGFFFARPASPPPLLARGAFCAAIS